MSCWFVATSIGNGLIIWWETGPSNTGTSSNGASGDGLANGNINHHQARVQAAAAAAAVYGKSFVYPSANMAMWYSLLISEL